MKIKIFSLAALAVMLSSCASDDSGNPTTNSNVISHFVETRSTVENGTNVQTQSILDYTIVDDRFGTYTIETFDAGVSLGTQSFADFYYQGDLLSSVQDFDGVREFHYDAQGRLVGAGRELILGGGVIYYRFVHQPGNVVFCERLDAPYNQAGAQIVYRNILDFDADDNLVSAGPDVNLDGQPDSQNLYENANGNITGADLSSGLDFVYNYSNIINNRQYLVENTYGKQVMRLMCSETYANANQDQIAETLFSKHLFDWEEDDATYETNADNFITKKTIIEPFDDTTQILIVTEYFFN
ncbi:MAG: hypothetical protein EOO50_17070 [Flavobacterium sp.]|uniref:hypothetical protein n=1 Tax=Flavobacterium sp. TaxID=239 RepID=UPI001222625E|nr:hypothetical protein [Flavobacterium sp.]RZJ63319.1 MAG: hypothetical protein EOO50_17070 [Flavobacterium sp.]